MKKLLFITLGLAALFGLTACVEQQNVSPTFNPVDNTINTQFVFNISSAAGESDPSTKQVDTIAQIKGAFRGIDNATLFAIIDPNMKPNSASALKKMVVPPDSAAAMRDLSQILSEDAFSSTDGGTRVVEINLPVGTNQLVFYAKAAKKAVAAPLNPKEIYGSLDIPVRSDEYIKLKDFIGSMAERRLSKADSADYSRLQNVIIQSFNGLLRTAVRVGSTDTNWYEKRLLDNQKDIEFGSKSYTVDTLRWADYACAGSKDNPLSPFFKDTDGNPLPASELEKILGNAYTAFSASEYARDIRAGSGSAGARILTDLYSIASAGAKATPVNLQEKVSQLVFEKLLRNVEMLSVSAGSALTDDRIWKSVSTVKGVVGVTAQISDGYDINKFPSQFNMPLGAATIGKDSLVIIPNPRLPMAGTGGYTRILQLKYVSSLDTLFNGGGNTYLYTYPVELCYYGNSSFRTSESNALTTQSFPSHENWSAPSQWSNIWGADGAAITNSTRGIAMTNTIQYGVALLKSQLEVSSKTLTDNSSLSGEIKQYELSNSHFLEWTGILVGGQPEQVGWDYLRKQTDGVKAGMNAIVYDKVNYGYSGKDTCGISITNSGLAGITNYTLLFDNVDPYMENDNAQGNVYVALEFVNHLGQDFWGEQGLIREGATFYLFAKLSPNPYAGDGNNTFWNKFFADSTHNNLLPPYNTATGQTRPIRRVFVQDVVTSVKFIFGDKALSHAYIAIPDLRSARLSMGLDVDLRWTEGLNYDAQLGQR